MIAPAWTAARAHERATLDAQARAKAASDEAEDLALFALHDAWCARVGFTVLSLLFPAASFELPPLRCIRR